MLWKKARRGELLPEEAMEAASRVGKTGVTLYPSAPLLADAMELGLDLGHPVYDRLYLALARRLGTELVTTDGRLIRKLVASGRQNLRDLARPLL